MRRLTEQNGCLLSKWAWKLWMPGVKGLEVCWRFLQWFPRERWVIGNVHRQQLRTIESSLQETSANQTWLRQVCVICPLCCGPWCLPSEDLPLLQHQSPDTSVSDKEEKRNINALYTGPEEKSFPEIPSRLTYLSVPLATNESCVYPIRDEHN